MSLRLNSTRKHPITGEDVKPLWFDQDGVAFYPPMGAAPDDEGTEGEEPEETEGGEEGSEGPEGSEKGSKTVTQEDLNKVLERMKAADRRAAAAEQKVKEFEDKDKSEVTKATERAAELEAQVTDLKEQVKSLNLQNAFLAENSIDWHNKDAALQRADLSEVLDAEGNVDKKALKKVLEDLAKAEPYLVKTESKEETPTEPSGIPAGTGRKGKTTGLTEEELRKKYPALNR